MSFWREKSLDDMTEAEWESLCDGCGKCCLHKLEDEDTGEIYHTEVACRLLDLETCRCRKYQDRRRYVGNCLTLRGQMDRAQKWLPGTCAYRLLAEGQDLPSWHPLVSGRAETVIEAGISVAGRAINEKDAGDYEDHLVDWPA